MSKDWISVDKQMPEEGTLVMAIVPKDSGGFYDPFTCFYSEKLGFHEDSEAECPTTYINPVSHWRKPPTPPQVKQKVLIIGYARHGKDTVAGMMEKHLGYNFKSSSEMAAEIFLFDKLKGKYGYQTFEECFEDRVNHRAEWKDEISNYNTPDKAKLAREILSRADMYVGMRDDEEIAACKAEGLFDLVIGVYDPRKPHEAITSCPIDIFEEADIIITNTGTLEELEEKVIRILKPILQ